MLILQFLAVIIALNLATACPSFADMYSDSELEWKRDDKIDDVDYTVNEQILYKRPVDIRARLGHILVRMPLRDDVNTSAPPHTAYSDSTTNEIILPVETLYFWGDIGLVFAWFDYRKCNIGPLTSYLYQVAKRDLNVAPMDAFGLNRSDLIEIPYVDKASLRITNTAINFILAHEMGHLFYGHMRTENVEVSQEQERLADQFALDSLADLNLPPFGLTFYFLAARYMEGYSWLSRYASHPTSPERLERVAARLRDRPDVYLVPGLPTAKHASDRERLLEIADTMDGIAEQMRDDVTLGIESRLLPELFPADQLIYACPP